MASTFIVASAITLPSEARHTLTWEPASLQVEAAGQEKRASWQKTALGKGEQANCREHKCEERTILNVLNYQLAGTSRVAQASLPGGAGEPVAAVDAGRGNGGEGVGSAK